MTRNQTKIKVQNSCEENAWDGVGKRPKTSLLKEWYCQQEGVGGVEGGSRGTRNIGFRITHFLVGLKERKVKILQHLCIERG